VRAWHAIRRNAETSRQEATKNKAKLFGEDLPKNLRALQTRLKAGYRFAPAYGATPPSLARETVQSVQFIHEDVARDDDMDTICRKVFHSGIQALRDSLSVLDPQALTRAVDAIRTAKRVEIYGIGSSAPIAEDTHYRMLRIGLDARVVTDSHIQAISASRCDPDVAVLTISHSGATHETVAAARLAKEAGARTIVITNFARSPIQAYADVVLFTMARETRFRTEAMTSRIAQLCVVDALIAALALGDYDRSTETLRQTFEVLSIKRF
jgi:DNA-binding MurR/RpiR family transcriptional regulator